MSGFFAYSYKRRVNNQSEPFVEIQTLVDDVCSNIGISSTLAVKTDDIFTYASADIDRISINENFLDSLVLEEKKALIGHELWHVRRLDNLPTFTSFISGKFAQAALEFSIVPLFTIQSLGLNISNELFQTSFETVGIIGISTIVSKYLIDPNFSEPTEEELYEMEFECDRVSIIAAKDLDSSISLFYSSEDFLHQNIPSISGWEAYSNWKAETTTHPSKQSRVNALKALKQPSHGNV